MEVIQFPPPKGLLDFEGMGIEIDVKQQRKLFDALFMSVQTALRFCNLDHVKAEEMARGWLGQGDLADRVGAELEESVRYLKGAVQVVEIGIARVEVSNDRALGRTRRNP
jgi:hypothetical protein